MQTYWFKLMNGEKIKVYKELFDDWLHQNRDFYWIITDKAEIFIKKEQIVLGYMLIK